MFEYVFFHETLAQQFEQKAVSLGIEVQKEADELCWQIMLPEDMPEEIEQQLSDFYDDLLDQDQDMYESEHTDTEFQGAALEITLKDGQKTYAETDPAIMGKILSVLEFDELNILIDDIVSAVENPNDKTMCERRRENEDDQ